MIDFETLWANWPKDIPKGPKKKAQEHYAKRNKPVDHGEEMLEGLLKQVAYRNKMKSKGEFCPNFPHVFRWIRDDRWTDPIPEIENERIGAMNALRKHLDRSWATENPLSPEENANRMAELRKGLKI